MSNLALKDQVAARWTGEGSAARIAAELSIPRGQVIRIAFRNGLEGAARTPGHPLPKEIVWRVEDLRRGGYSMRAIAEMLDLGEGTVKSMCRRKGFKPGVRQ